MSEVLDFARYTAREAGSLLRRYAHQRHDVRHKSTDIDLVTEADVASERLIVAAIRERFPGHTILAEEGEGDTQKLIAGAETLWLVDPLDGTVNYAHGFPMWAVSLALAQRGQVVVAVTYSPLHDEMFWAERGQGAWLNGARVRTSSAGRLRDALLATGFAYRRATLKDNNLAEFNAMMPRVQGLRRAGAAVLDMALLACGRLDAYWEMHLQPWDWAAGWLLVKEAGGVVTDLHGEPWSLDKDNIAASNGPALHQRLLAGLRGEQAPEEGAS
ncbi:MAG: inositol monophosphatase family protein [Anaerolineae bacterium]